MSVKPLDDYVSVLSDSRIQELAFQVVDGQRLDLPFDHVAYLLAKAIYDGRLSESHPWSIEALQRRDAERAALEAATIVASVMNRL